jgi:pimeloyl-ACP methyl ester carboxylesterase
LAVLYYDKRGVGSSGGEYGSSLRQLALDGIAAVRYLRSRPEVNPHRVGLRGLSEGAWVAEQVAADLGDLAFLILVSGAASTPRDQEFQKVEYGMRSDGRPEQEIEDALAYLGLYFYVARTGEGWPLLEAATKRAQGQEWGQYVDQPRSQEDLAWWHENHAFQPGRVVAGLDLPVLLLYGEEDWMTPPVENGEKLRSLFPSPKKVEVRVFVGADHRLEISSGWDEKGLWHWPSNAAATQPTIADWLETHGLK